MTGVLPGDDVRIAGVKVGQVTGIGLVGDAQRGADVHRRRRRSRSRPSVHATIRYRNLVGQRYVALTEGPGDRWAGCRPAA